jgi:hypothetical protein
MGTKVLYIEAGRNKPECITCLVSILPHQVSMITIEHDGFDWDRENGIATLHHELPDGDFFKLSWAGKDAE